MLAVNVFAAGSDAEGYYLKSSMQQAFANLRSGRPGKLPRPVEDVDSVIDPSLRGMVDQALACSATGGPDKVRRELSALIARYAPDEVILTGQIHDHAARVRSFEIAAGVMQDMAAPQRRSA
jgi:alkanesulfonate monooxygenase SsuD/methylene tetrahydromethanopterin reductase-like flavin-dependent oxidoreductase (luciferase family)